MSDKPSKPLSSIDFFNSTFSIRETEIRRRLQSAKENDSHTAALQQWLEHQSMQKSNTDRIPTEKQWFAKHFSTPSDDCAISNETTVSSKNCSQIFKDPLTLLSKKKKSKVKQAKIRLSRLAALDQDKNQDNTIEKRQDFLTQQPNTTIDNTEEKNVDAISNPEIPLTDNENLKKLIAQTYQSLFPDKTLSAGVLRKKIKEAQEKRLLQVHLSEVLENISQEYLQGKTQNKKENTDRENSDSKNVDSKNIDRETSDSSTDILGVAELVKSVDTYRVEKFNIKDDEQLVENFAENYQILYDIAGYNSVLDEIDKKNKKDPSGEIPVSTRTKMAFFTDLKQSYENRAKLISSPFFLLLRNREIDAYLKTSDPVKAEIEPGLADYIRLYESIRNSRIMKEKSHIYFNRLLKAQKNLAAERDKTRIEPLYREIRTLNQTKTKRLLDPLFNETQNTIFPENSSQTTEIKNLKELYCLKKFKELENFPSSEEDFYQNANLPQPTLQELIQIRRDFASEKIAYEFVRLLAEGAHCDWTNDRFTKTRPAQVLLSYITSDKTLPAIFSDRIDMLKKRYEDTLTHKQL